MFEQRPIGVENFLKHYLEVHLMRPNEPELPKDPLKFWQALSKDVSCPPALLPLVRSLLCIMPSSTSVERSFKLLKRIVTKDRCAMSRRTEILLHFILANMKEMDVYRDFELFSSSIAVGIVGERNYEDTYFSDRHSEGSSFSVRAMFDLLACG